MLNRRVFFRQFGSQMLRAAAQVTGELTSLRELAARPAADFDTTLGTARDPAARYPRDQGLPAGLVPAFTAERDRLLLVDQRRLPDELVQVECRTGSDVVQAIRDRILPGGPAIGQVAALGIALAANAARVAKAHLRHAEILGTATPLMFIRSNDIGLRRAVQRMMDCYEAVRATTGDGPAIAEALWGEAAAIVVEAAEDQERLVSVGSARLSSMGVEKPLRLLTRASTGPLACGQRGTALGVIDRLVNDGREVHAFVAETRPRLSGSRITAWELSRAGIWHTIVVDAAGGWLMATEQIDAVLLGAETVLHNGDAICEIGGYSVAAVAARHAVPVFVCVPVSAVGPATPGAASVQREVGPPAEVLRSADAAIAPPGTQAINPLFDVIPAELVTEIVTDEGVLSPPFGPALAAAAERHRGRHRRAALA